MGANRGAFRSVQERSGAFRSVQERSGLSGCWEPEASRNTHTCTHKDTHTPTRTHTHTHTHTHKRTLLHAYKDTRARTHKDTHAQGHTSKDTHVRTHTHTHKDTRTHKDTHTYTHTYTHSFRAKLSFRHYSSPTHSLLVSPSVSLRVKAHFHIFLVWLLTDHLSIRPFVHLSIEEPHIPAVMRAGRAELRASPSPPPTTQEQSTT